MKRKTEITLTKERRDDMIASIKDYFSVEREEELGDLAPEMYNQGVYDAHRYIAEAAEDLLALQQ